MPKFTTKNDFEKIIAKNHTQKTVYTYTKNTQLTLVNGGVKLGHGAAQNWATLGLRGTRVMSGGQSAALSM